MLRAFAERLVSWLPRARVDAGSFIPNAGEIGADFPEWRAADRHVGTGPAEGLLRRPEDLGLPLAMADFYRFSAAYRIVLQSHFPFVSRRLLPWFRRTFADPWQQLQFPLAPNSPLTDRFVAVGDEAWWVRAGPEGTMYCARFDAFELGGVHRLRVSIPTPSFTLIAVFTPHITPKMLRFGQDASPTGLYVAPRDGPLRRMPFFREEIVLAEARTGLVVRHGFRMAGMELATLRYLVERR